MADRLDATALRGALNYAPDTGVFTWKPRRRIVAGSIAGNLNQNGYINIKLNGRLYKAHRLAWLYVHGTDPIGVIDHINRDKTDNRINNLRDCGKSANGHNRERLSNNRNGTTGVYFEPRYGGKWCAKITHRGRRQYLGSFASQAMAADAYNYAQSQIIKKETYA